MCIIRSFFTEGCEERRVSRDVKRTSLEDHRYLGVCVACRELRIRLIGRYGLDFYMAFMNVHSNNCLTGSKQRIEELSDFDGWIHINPFTIIYDNYCSMNYDYFADTKMVGLSFQGMGDSRFIFSDKGNVPSRVISESRQVLICDRKGNLFVNKLISEIPFGQVSVSQVSGVINLSHSRGMKNVIERDSSKDIDEETDLDREARRSSYSDAARKLLENVGVPEQLVKKPVTYADVTKRMLAGTVCAPKLVFDKVNKNNCVRCLKIILPEEGVVQDNRFCHKACVRKVKRRSNVVDKKKT